MWQNAATRAGEVRTDGPFWMVKGPTGPSRSVHATEESAELEAQRLAAACPGQEFFVLKTTKAFKVQAPMVCRTF